MKDVLINLLKEEQEKNGYLSEDILKGISKKTGVPISRLWGIATFYFLLHTEKQGKYVIHVCNSPSCYLNDSMNILEVIEKELDLKLDQTTGDGKFSLYATSCIGCCDEAPAMTINGKLHTKLTEEKVKEILKECK